MAVPPSSRIPRPLHPRKRFAAIRLSADTTGSLPAYSSPSSRQATDSDWTHSHLLGDQPPDYPQSAEEADQEDDFIPLRGSRSTGARRPRHRRSESNLPPPTPSVDDLLQRSVVALEMSTDALLQSMNAQSSLSTLTNDRILERSLDRQTRLLDLRIRSARHAHEGWMDDLEQLIKGVDGLLVDRTDLDSGVSRSLPTGNSHIPRRRGGRRSALSESKSDTPYLHLSTSELDLRESLRPPRAVTQYVSVESASGVACETTADSQSIYLPSTIGPRSAAHIRAFTGGGTRPPRLRQSASSPGLDSRSASTTPAYNMLSHLATQHSPRSPSRTTSPTSLPSPGASDSPSRSTARRYSAGSVESNVTLTGLRRSRSNSRGRSSISTEPPPPVRAMTPPMEEATPSSSLSSLDASHTLQSLRKILDSAPPDPKAKRRQPPSTRRRFLPRSPAVTPSSGTSTATASVTRLFKRPSHHGLAQERPSSLKKAPIPASPSANTPSTAPSTPRNVSFAELPDSYSGQSPRRGRNKGREKGKGRDSGKDQGQRRVWWSGWFADVSGGAVGGGAMARHEERMEDRFMRGWGRPGISSGGTEEWMI